MDETKKELIREFSAYFESSHNFPPLTSKVYAYLLLDCESIGVTFDELTEIFNASKSSISNSLNFLTQIKQIEYYTKIENRKRFYRTVPNNLILRLQNIQEMLSNEKRLSEKLRTYKLEIQNNQNDLNKLKSDIYIEHLESVVKQLNSTIEKLNNLSKTHHK